MTLSDQIWMWACFVVGPTVFVLGIVGFAFMVERDRQIAQRRAVRLQKIELAGAQRKLRVAEAALDGTEET